MNRQLGPLLEDALRRAYYYTETGAWHGPLTEEEDRWRAVAKVAAEQVAAERERCAKLCEQEHNESSEHPEMALHCAERIRGLRA